jgi:hypothetical protein
MSRNLLVGVAAVALATMAAACGGVSAPVGNTKLTAGELEQFLVEADPGGPRYKCETAKRGGWDYVCAFTDESGQRLNIDVMVNDRQATRSSGTYAAEASEAAEVENDAPTTEWLARVNSLCRWAKDEAAQTPEPQTLRDFELYVIALRDITERYRSKLAALPAAPHADDRATFQTLLLHLREDKRLATELLVGIRANDRAVITQYFERLQLQAAEENRLFARMGACPAS